MAHPKAEIKPDDIKKRRPRVWDDDYRPYGRRQGPPGNPDMYRKIFERAYHMSGAEAEAIVGDDSPWGILGVAVGSAAAVVKAAFAKLILIWHPDKFAGNSKAEQDHAHKMVKRIIADYKVIKGNT